MPPAPLVEDWWKRLTCFCLEDLANDAGRFDGGGIQRVSRRVSSVCQSDECSCFRLAIFGGYFYARRPPRRRHSISMTFLRRMWLTDRGAKQKQHDGADDGGSVLIAATLTEPDHRSEGREFILSTPRM